MTILEIPADKPKKREKSEQEKAVFKALENPNYKWRTIRGASEETGLPGDFVVQVITSWPDEIIASSVSSTTGEDLYTTRSHYAEKSTILDKISRTIRFST